jgi:hypothetical protein
MAAPNFFIVVANTAPAYQITCQRSGTDIDLSGASVAVILYNKSTKAVVNAGHQTATVVTASLGLISYSAQATDFSTKGKYVADIQVTYGDSTVEILYNQATWKVRNKGA